MKSLHESMLNQALFGRTFAAETFRNRRTVAKVLDGLPLDPEEFAFYRTVTGRNPPSKAFSEAYLIKPRRVRAGRCLPPPWACTRRCRTIAPDWALVVTPVLGQVGHVA